MRRSSVLFLLMVLAACSRSGGEAAPSQPKEAVRKTSASGGRVEETAALLVSLFPSIKGERFVCESPLQAERVPLLKCHVGSDASRLLDVEIGYGSRGPWFVILSGELVHTRELVALQDAGAVRYGPQAKEDVAKLVATLQPSIETFFQRPLGRPELEIHRVPLRLGGKNTSAIVWTARYPGGGSLQLEPIGGMLIRAEF